MELVEVGILTEDDIEQATTSVFNPVIKFKFQLTFNFGIMAGLYYLTEKRPYFLICRTDADLRRKERYGFQTLCLRILDLLH